MSFIFTPCKYNGCTDTYTRRVKGYCRKHYDQRYRENQPNRTLPLHAIKIICRTNGCTQAAILTDGLCKKHHQLKWMNKKHRQCQIAGCEVAAFRLKLCQTHYEEYSNTNIQNTDQLKFDWTQQFAFGNIGQLTADDQCEEVVEAVVVL